MPTRPVTAPLLSDQARATLIGRFGSQVSAWCDELPRLVAAITADWRLRVHRLLPAGGTSVVLLCHTDDDDPVVLKLTPDPQIAAAEQTALDAWCDSPYVVALLDADIDRGALLLEALHPGASLHDEPAARSLPDIAPLLTNLWSPRPTGVSASSSSSTSPNNASNFNARQPKICRDRSSTTHAPMRSPSPATARSRCSTAISTSATSSALAAAWSPSIHAHASATATSTRSTGHSPAPPAAMTSTATSTLSPTTSQHWTRCELRPGARQSSPSSPPASLPAIHTTGAVNSSHDSPQTQPEGHGVVRSPQHENQLRVASTAGIRPCCRHTSAEGVFWDWPGDTEVILSQKPR